VLLERDPVRGGRYAVLVASQVAVHRSALVMIGVVVVEVDVQERRRRRA
jgi:hypothetical protein